MPFIIQGKTNWKFLLIVIILAIGLCGGVLGWQWSEFKKEMKISEFKLPEKVKDETVDWKIYKHDVIGIEFRYPAEWGEPYTEPTRCITKLSNVVDKYTGDNLYNNSIFILFTDNDRLKIHIFNDKYEGEKYPNVYAYNYGYIDNIPKLKITENICDYEIDFDHRPSWSNTLEEIYTECNNHVKTSLIKDLQFFDWLNKTLYVYSLKHFAFKKLKNDFFNNAIISYYVGGTGQIETSYLVFDDFFKIAKPDMDKSAYEKQRNEFVNFINSIKVFVPPQPPLANFEIIEGEDYNITTIRKYYFLLTANRLSEAYEMRSDKDVISYEQFQDWYKNIHYAKPYDFKKMENNNYEFYIEYQDHNEPKKKFRVITTVNGDKLKPLSVVEILTEKVSFGEYSAYAIRKNNKNYMILAKNEVETIIDEGNADVELGNVKFFNTPQFSPKGNYLIYTIIGWEWSNKIVYDIEKKEKVLEIAGAYGGFDFTPDEKFFYVCSGSDAFGYSDILGKVYTIPEFNLDYDLSENQKDFCFNSIDCNITCRYDEANESIVFELNWSCAEGTCNKTIRYFLKDKNIEIID